MRATGSNTAFRRVPRADMPALAQFEPKPRLDLRRAVQIPDVHKPLFEKKPNLPAPRQLKSHSGRFDCCRHSFFC